LKIPTALLSRKNLAMLQDVEISEKFVEKCQNHIASHHSKLSEEDQNSAKQQNYTFLLLKGWSFPKTSDI
jgi:DNA replicative helicase MCM subunit Mcm2 (Cdc46/Mcm family)